MHDYCTLTYDEDLQAYQVMLADHAGRPSRLFLTEDSLAQMIADAAVVYADRHHCAMFETHGMIYVISVVMVDGRQVIDLVTDKMWDAESRCRLLRGTKNEDVRSIRYAGYKDNMVQVMEEWYIDHLLNNTCMIGV